MMAYKCDVCGKYFDWYEVAYYQKKFNNMTMREMHEWEEKHKDADYWHSTRCCVGANSMELKQFDPINDNMSSNDGVLSADINSIQDGNNHLIVMCPNCMTDFLTSVGYWDRM